MEIRLLEDRDIPAAKKLWGYAFERDEPFYSWYFKEVFQPENCLGVFFGGQLACCLQIPSYTLQLNGSSFDASYVVGVITAAEYRNKGIMKALLTKTIEEMHARDHAVSILMPFDTTFYRPYGWELCYSQLDYEIPIHILKGYRQKEGVFQQVDLKRDIDALNQVYQKFTENCHGYVQRNATNWERILKDLYHWNGYAYLLRDHKGEPAGYIQYFLKGNRLIAKEIACINHWAKQSIFGFMYNHNSQVDVVQWYAPISDHTYLYLRDTIKPKPTNAIKIRPFMCGRIISVEKALARCRFSPKINMTFRIKIEDAYALWNNKIFLVSIYNGVPFVEESPSHQWDMACNINTFAQLFFGAVDIDEAIGLNQMKIHEGFSSQNLSQIFYRKNNYINEYF